MRKVSGTKTVVAALAFATLAPAAASAQDVYKLIQNQNGFDLPGVSLPQGQDEVRAADGTTCRSSISNAGAYFDVGVIKNGNSINMEDMAAYGRVVIPLGKKAKRLDCSQLYQLEIERLKMELDLLKMGLSADASLYTGSTEPVASSAAADAKQVTKKARKKAWLADGWSTEGQR
jgi:hypothetical protein